MERLYEFFGYLYLNYLTTQSCSFKFVFQKRKLDSFHTSSIRWLSRHRDDDNQHLRRHQHHSSHHPSLQEIGIGRPVLQKNEKFPLKRKGERKIEKVLKTHIHTYTHIQTYKHTYIHIYTYVHKHTYIHTYTYKHTYIHTYTYTWIIQEVTNGT